MADDNANSKLEKTITLTKLKPTEYRLWVVQAEATFEVYKYFGIVLWTESNPTPINEDGQFIGPIDETLQASITSWEYRHVLAKEALLKALDAPEMLKILPHKDSAPAIWTRLKQIW